MDKVLLLFSLESTIEKEPIRSSFIRIPEVTVPLRTAQNFLDRFSSSKVDLLNFAGSSAEDFGQQPQLKTLVTSLIQWGLYQRFVTRTSIEAEWMIGDARGNQGIMGLILGRLSFSEFLWHSSVADGSPAISESLPGKSLTNLEFRIYGQPKDGEAGFKDLSDPSLDRWKLVEKCVSELGAKRVVTLGPAFDFSADLMRRRSLLEFDLIESTDLDPQLQWLSPTASASV